MADARYTILYEGDGIRIGDYDCHAPRHGRGAVELSARFDISIVRRGTFVTHHGSDERIATPVQAVFFRPGDEYRTEHPVDGGDACTVFSLPSDVIRFRRSAPVPARAFLEQELLLARLRSGSASALEVEERTWHILGSLEEPPATTVTPRQRATVRRAIEILTAHAGESLTLARVAAACATSPFHLTRLFRLHFGQPMHRYLTTLRLRRAVQRLAAGETNLTTLALDLGYADHSHFTTAFRREFGMPPSAARTRLWSAAAEPPL